MGNINGVRESDFYRAKVTGIGINFKYMTIRLEDDVDLLHKTVGSVDMTRDILYSYFEIQEGLANDLTFARETYVRYIPGKGRVDTSLVHIEGKPCLSLVLNSRANDTTNPLGYSQTGL